MKRMIALMLVLSLLLCGCGSAAPAAVTQPVIQEPQRVTNLAARVEGGQEAVDFALKLLENSFDGSTNTLISPLSVYAALGMTVNGADGDTLVQMLETLGLSREQLNAWIGSYMENQTEELKLANSIWMRQDDSLKVEPDFLKTNTDTFRAELFQTPMDAETLQKINQWVAENTDDMIPEMLDQIPENMVMFLINALAFEAGWEDPYQNHNVWEQDFTTETGVVQSVEMMHSIENLYLETDNATGFIKFYEGRKYAFAVLLPTKGVSIRSFVDGLTGVELNRILSQAQAVRVDAAMPKFALEYDTELTEILKTMGITNAFDVETADFSRLGRVEGNNIYISQILHKTAITVAEEGTKAAAATSAGMAMGSALIQEERKEVILDRPFVYMLIDCQQNYPFFLGTLMDAEGGAVSALTMQQEPVVKSEPPLLTVNFGDQRMTLSAGNYEWKMKLGDMEETVLVCGPGSMDYMEGEPMVRTESANACLFWPMDTVAPGSITVTGWTEGEEAVPLELMDGCIPLDAAIRVYEISVSWESLGTATYIFSAQTK